MRVHWTELETEIFSAHELYRRIEIQNIKRQIETLLSLLPDEVLLTNKGELNKTKMFVGVLLFADVSGFTPLCEKYNKSGKGGIYKLTATLNCYIGALVEVIYFYGGDVLKFSGDAFLAVWKAGTDCNLYKVIHEVIVCALFIQNALGEYETEVNTLLRVKLAIACGNIYFAFIGDDKNRYYVITGTAVEDVKQAERSGTSGDVIVAPTAWGHCSATNYDYDVTESGHIRVWKAVYKVTQLHIKEMYDKKYIQVMKLCEKHVNHCNTLYKNHSYDNTLDSKITANFVTRLPQRKSVIKAESIWIAPELRPFIIKPVYEHILERQPLDYLTEMRSVTIMFINIKIIPRSEHKLINLIDKAYLVICEVTDKALGCVNKVLLFDKDAMMLVIFGLRGQKHEISTRNAIKNASEICRQFSQVEEIESASIGITTGPVYCGVVGHPLRKEYTVIGTNVNKAARMMCTYESKVTCDQETYINSKLGSCYFRLLPALKLKGIEEAGNIFEYNEEFDTSFKEYTSETSPLGRTEEIELADNVLNIPQVLGNVHCIIFHGDAKVGKSKLIKYITGRAMTQRHVVAFVMLTNGSSSKPYSCLNLLYKQFYDHWLLTKHGAARLPFHVWSIMEILQTAPHALDKTVLNRKAKILDQFRDVIRHYPMAVVIIDNLHYIDHHSWELLESLLNEKYMRIIATTNTKEAPKDWLCRIEENKRIKVVPLPTININLVPTLACQMLNVHAIAIRLIKLLQNTTRGIPGYVEICLLRLVNNGSIEVTYMSLDSVDTNKFIMSDLKLFNKRITKTDNMGTTIVTSVANLSPYFNAKADEMTLKDITLDLFDFFTPHQQLLIKTGSILGEIFDRITLKMLMNFPSEKTLSHAIKVMFEEDVMDCGTKFITSGGTNKLLECKCYFEGDELKLRQQQYCLPKYAHCKLLYFKNKYLRTVVYELLPANQKKELHSRSTDILDSISHICPNCLRGKSSYIVRPKSYKEIMTEIMYDKRSEHKRAKIAKKHSEEDLENDIKNIIRNHVHENSKTKMEKVNHSLQQKVWDSAVCFCLEILTRVYADLVSHCKAAGLHNKKIFYLLQYGIICITMEEYEDAIQLLTEASELCMTDASENNTEISVPFRKYHIGKIHTILAHAYIMLGKPKIAKPHLAISLRQYNAPMLSLDYTLPNAVVNRFTVKKFRNKLHKTEFAHCLLIVSNYFAQEKQWKLAKNAALKSLTLLKNANSNINIICDAYSSAIDMYSYSSQHEVCEKLINSVAEDILEKYGGNVLIDLIAIGRLMVVIFYTKIMCGKLEESIRLGYRALYLNNVIKANVMRLEATPILATVLILNKRILEAVELMKVFCDLCRTYSQATMTDYYAFCVELLVETSFELEPIKVCQNYMNTHFENGVLNNELSIGENKFLVYMLIHHARNSMWTECYKIRSMLNININDCKNLTTAITLMKYAESEITMFLRDQRLKNTSTDLDKKCIKNLLIHCKTIADKWKVLYPRYFHLKAYYNKVRGKNRSLAKLLDVATNCAKHENNFLELAWITKNRNAWSKYAWTGQRNTHYINWRLAGNLEVTAWSQILYPLPFVI